MGSDPETTLQFFALKKRIEDVGDFVHYVVVQHDGYYVGGVCVESLVGLKTIADWLEAEDERRPPNEG